MHIIETNQLTKYYGKARGIMDVSLQVEEGEVFGFIGPNGAGNQPPFACSLSLIYPTSGSATIFGKDCIQFGPEIRQEIGYLPSEVFYYEGMKVLDLLKYSASFFRKDCTKRMLELADLMELDLKRRIDDLSYGNKKKVGIVQGLLHQPRLIILDEPTAGLDPLMQQKFFNLIQDENRRGATVFFSSHILTEVQKLCQPRGDHQRRQCDRHRGSENPAERPIQENSHHLRQIAGEGFSFAGVTGMERLNGSLSFFYKGDINLITQKISTEKLSDLSIEDPTLEEIFLHYYE